MELPPYRVPTVRNIAQHTWGKSVQYLTKMGTVILAASVIVWALGYFPRPTENMSESEQIERSYIGRIGHAIEPVMKPLGFDWKIGVSLFTGLGAKEIVVSSMGVLYQADAEVEASEAEVEALADGADAADVSAAGSDVEVDSGSGLAAKLRQQAGFTPLVAYGFMLFILIYVPCFAALSAIRREAGWKWVAFNVVYTTSLAWLIAFAVHQIGGLLM
jgi:ferrous iron transport protein B